MDWEKQIMSKHISYLVAVAALLCFARVEAQTDKMPPAMQADVEFTYALPNGDTFTRRGQIYRSSNGKVRQDTGTGTMITDLKTGTVTMLIAERSEARVLTIPAELRAPPLLGSEKAVVPAKVAPFEETMIDGRPIAKTRIVGKQGETQEVWTATDIGVVTYARVQANGTTTTTQLRNLSAREPDPKVFEVPKNYKIVNEPTRLDDLSSRVPAARDLPFGAGTRVIPVPPAQK
jgi:hypothetical protein